MNIPGEEKRLRDQEVLSIKDYEQIKSGVTPEDIDSDPSNFDFENSRKDNP